MRLAEDLQRDITDEVIKDIGIDTGDPPDNAPAVPLSVVPGESGADRMAPAPDAEKPTEIPTSGHQTPLDSD